jgi:ketosteroid isomerase-like protein
VTSNRSSVPDASLRDFLASFEEGTRRFMNGDTSLWKENVSRRSDAMIMGAWGAYEKGWPEVSARYDWAGARFRDSGASLEIEYLTSFVSGDLAYTTEIERALVQLVGQESLAPMALRVTHVFRKEDGAWKLILRHADPLVGKTAPASVLQTLTATPSVGSG